MLRTLLVGILMYPFRYIFKARQGIWLFGADMGERYSQNSKYLFEYVRKELPEIKAYWVTQNKIVYNDLIKRGIPVIYNASFKGFYFSMVAEIKFMSTWFNDIQYTFPSRKQKVAYLMHGMPAKKIYYDRSISNESTSFLLYCKQILTKWFIYDYKLEYSIFTPATSEYFRSIIMKAMHNENVFVTGQPRTDAFLRLNQSEIRGKYGFGDNEFIVSYLPTHRSYGKGEPSPHIFIDNIEAIDYFKQNNISIVWKQHINMLNKYDKITADYCFKEFSFDTNIDVQELMFISNVLITDFSSCFVDFLMLNRPLLFYHYDDYENNDNEVYLNSKDLSKVGRVSHNEDELFKHIVNCYNNDVRYLKKDTLFYNEYNDDNSCERCIVQIQSILGK